MTNKEHWDNYTSGLSSPQNFIDWGWFYTISAALQRRVWLGPENQQCFPNMYVILVGEPGIGKGLVIKEVSEVMRFWKRRQALTGLNGEATTEQKEIAQATIEKDIQEAQKAESQESSKASDTIEPPLFPVVADAITYEALTQATGKAFMRINYLDEKVDEQGKRKLRSYGHSSPCFILPELSSLIRKKSESTVQYLLGLYDCPLDYEYVTKTQGKDRVRRGCINLIAGTTPGFMQSTFDERLLSEGFTSRTFYIFASKNRKNQFFIPSLSESQLESKRLILEHVRKLASLYGHVNIDKETADFLQEWYNDMENNKHKRKNQSTKMVPFYSRMNIHIMKLTMARHFSESTEMFIPLERFKETIAFLDKEVKTMHLAITINDNTPFNRLITRVIQYLKGGKKNWVDLMVECQCPKHEMEEVLDFLRDTEQIKVESEKVDEDETVNYWSIK